MLPNTAQTLLPIIKAFSEGKTIQYNESTGWKDSPNPSFTGIPARYRIKPEPRWRRWKETEVPVGALIRPKGGEIHGLILGLRDGEVVTCNNTYSKLYCLEFTEYSRDNGKTWSPCGIEIKE